ncbi:MAG: peptide-methionine (S)-S-oxide reductase MsrA [Burkholderiales bacterium]|nr:peptide-methionine (S)-S-oxide reductase MsrA [Burkholderiales bacterium]
MQNSPSSTSSSSAVQSESITLGGGCFWCTEAVFVQVRGITDVESGYCNGTTHNPSYEAVCSGQTGHAEVVKLEFDPAQISLREILEIFFVIHDPTTLNQQGHDVGTQYRSGIYVNSPHQQGVVQSVLREVHDSKTYRHPVVTEVLPLANYWPAEEYHQDYFEKHPSQGYCLMVAAPKVEKFRKTFSRLAKS